MEETIVKTEPEDESEEFECSEGDACAVKKSLTIDTKPLKLDIGCDRDFDADSYIRPSCECCNKSLGIHVNVKNSEVYHNKCYDQAVLKEMERLKKENRKLMKLGETSSAENKRLRQRRDFLESQLLSKKSKNISIPSLEDEAEQREEKPSTSSACATRNDTVIPENLL